MRGFVLGVAVGALGMGIYTGHINISVGGQQVFPPEKDPETPETFTP